MNKRELHAMRHYVREVQKIVYKTRDCIISGCDNCDRVYICEITNRLLKFIQHEINRYNAKGELKDDNN